MEIITKKDEEIRKGRLLDGIDTILDLSEEDFEELYRRFVQKEEIKFYYTTDKCENEAGKEQIGLAKYWDEQANRIYKAYYTSEAKIKPVDLLKALNDILVNFKEDDIKYKRISRLLEVRNLQAYKSEFSRKNRVNKNLVEKVFLILSDEELLEKFLDFENNKEEFNCEGEAIEISRYLEILGKIFGKLDSNNEIDELTNNLKEFYIPEIEKYKEAYIKIDEKYNLEMYANPKYKFEQYDLGTRTLRRGQEPEWNINLELYKKVMENIPSDMSLEEKAIYIYCKLCKELIYDEGYMYRGVLGKLNYTSDFSKEYLESIKPGDKITCFDFSRIFYNMINGLDDKIEAVILIHGGNAGHFSTGFYTDKVSVHLDAIDPKYDQTGSCNDLMKIKSGIELGGIEIVSDKFEIMKDIITKAYSKVVQERPKTKKEYLEMLKNIPKQEDFEENPEAKLKAFIKVMKEKNITGDEFTQTLISMYKSGFLGTTLKNAYLGKLEEQEDGTKKYKRMVLFSIKEKEDETRRLYLLDSNSLELMECTEEEMKEKLKTEELIYEDNKHQIEGLENIEK